MLTGETYLRLHGPVNGLWKSLQISSRVSAVRNAAGEVSYLLLASLVSHLFPFSHQWDIRIKLHRTDSNWCSHVMILHWTSFILINCQKRLWWVSFYLNFNQEIQSANRIKYSADHRQLGWKCRYKENEFLNPDNKNLSEWSQPCHPGDPGSCNTHLYEWLMLLRHSKEINVPSVRDTEKLDLGYLYVTGTCTPPS